MHQKYFQIYYIVIVSSKQASLVEIPYMILQYQCYTVTFQGLFCCIPVQWGIPAPNNTHYV